jgi:hypothetical protein
MKGSKAGGHWFEPSTAHPKRSAKRAFSFVLLSGCAWRSAWLVPDFTAVPVELAPVGPLLADGGVGVAVAEPTMGSGGSPLARFRGVPRPQGRSRRRDVAMKDLASGTQRSVCTGVIVTVDSCPRRLARKSDHQCAEQKGLRL